MQLRFVKSILSPTPKYVRVIELTKEQYLFRNNLTPETSEGALQYLNDKPKIYFCQHI